MEENGNTPPINWRGLVDWGRFFGPCGSPGGVDMVCAGSSRLPDRIGELLFVVLTGLLDADGKQVYGNALVVLPPTMNERRDAIVEHIIAATKRIRGAPPDNEELEIVRRKIIIRRAPDFDAISLVETICDVPARTLVFVIDSALYRTADIELGVHPVGTARIDEDLWVHHLHALASASVPLARAVDACIILDAGEGLPVRESSCELLRSVETCGVFGGNYVLEPGETILADAEGWLGHIKMGRPDLAILAIDGLPASLAKHKAAFKIQALHMGGDERAAIELLRIELMSGNRFDARFRVRAAHIADAGGEHAIAVDLLQDTVDSLRQQEWIEQALILSRRLCIPEVENKCIERLEMLFPRSVGLRDHYFVKLLRACESLANGRAPGELGGLPRFVAFSNALLHALQIVSDSAYSEAIAIVEEQWPEYAAQARLGCAVHAHESNQVAPALDLSNPGENSGDFARHAASILLWGIEQRLLGGTREPPEQETLARAVAAVLSYLAKHPNDVMTRVQLTRLMSVQVSGTLGIALLAYVVRGLPNAKQQTLERRKRAKADATGEEFRRFFESALVSLKDKGPLQVGLSQLPESLMVPSADALFDWVVDMIDDIGRKHDDPEDLAFLETLVAVGSAIVPHTRAPEDDLLLLRVAAGKLAVAGKSQKARDYVEHGLGITRGDPLRARIAWYGFADIYQRGRNAIEALVGMGCALSCETSISAQQAFYETYGLIRLLRDLGMVELAARLLPDCEALIDRLGIRSSMAHRLATIQLGLRLQTVGPLRDPESLRALATEALQNLRTVLEQKDEAMPVAVMVAQILQMCDEAGVTINASDRSLLDQTATALGNNAALLMRLSANPKPTGSEVLEWLQRTEAARYSEDVGYDVQILVRAARRLLTTAEAAHDSTVAIFAAELTTDHGVTMPGPAPKGDERPDWLPSTIEMSGRRAAEISLRGITVSVLALDEHDRLVRITAEDGVLQPVIIEEENVFSERRLSEWSQTFPYAYGFESDDPNLFYNSTRGLGLSQRAAKRVVLVFDTELQRLSPNLIVVNDELVGSSTAMSVAPSIAWLYAAVTTTQPRQFEPPVAWISTATEGGTYGTLEMLAGRLHDPLEQHGITLLTGSEVPNSLERAELAIVAAHGGIALEGRYFQVVADEDDMRMSSVSLSRALANAGVVILFVCSGGRFDKHPIASTAVALPKELLDRGCSAVVGSPWPLESSVPAYWLPSFLGAWYAGAYLIDAVFQANSAVSERLGNSPARCLAMTVYGNPLVVRQTSGASDARQTSAGREACE